MDATPLPTQPATAAEYATAQDWWSLMYPEDFEAVRFVDGEPEYSGGPETSPHPLDEVFTSHFILYF